MVGVFPFEPAAGSFDPSGASIVHADDFPAFEISPGRFFRLADSENMTLNLVTFPPHSGFEHHAHPEEQMSVVIEGEMELTLGETTRAVRPGDVFIIPSNVPHSGLTHELGCRVVDVYSPARPDIHAAATAVDPVRGGDVDPWWEPR